MGLFTSKIQASHWRDDALCGVGIDTVAFDFGYRAKTLELKFSWMIARRFLKPHRRSSFAIFMQCLRFDNFHH